MKAPESRIGRLLLVPLVILIVTAVWLGLDREAGIGAMGALRSELRQAESRVDALVGERASLLRRVRALRSEPLALEREARLELGMARPGEVIVRWIEPETVPPN